MPTPLRRRLRLTRRYASYTLALGVVLVALLVGALSQLLPLVERQPQKVEAWLSARAGQPVHFDAMRTEWTRRGPLLRLQGLRVGARDGVRVGEAEVMVAMYSGLLPGRSLTELRLRNLALTLQRAEDGAWSVQGLPSTGSGDPLDALRRLGELQVVGGRLKVHAPGIGIDTELPRIDLRLRVSGHQVRAGGRAWIDTAHAPLSAVLDFDRHAGDGTAYAAASPADLAAWSPLLKAAGVQLAGGEGRAQVWAQLRANRIVAVTTQADLGSVRLRGTAANGPVPAVAWDRLQASLRWRTTPEGWRVDAPLLRITTGGKVQPLDSLSVAIGRRYAMSGRNLDATPLLAVLGLTDQVEPGLRRWLQQSRPALRLGRLRVAGEQGGPLWAEGRLDELAFASAGHAPGLSGLQGEFEGDADGVRLRPVPAALVRFDWPWGFGVVHELRLAGEIVGWREGGGWRVATPALRVQSHEYAANVRGGLWFQADGTRPRIDLAAELDDAPVPVASMFWVHGKMSQNAVDWLDMALAGGTVTGGTGLVSGDLDEWPFDERNGRFEATGHIRDGVIRFQRDWPAMEQVEADVAFIGNGFELHGRGDLAGAPVGRLEAGIPDFGEGQLYVRAQTDADASRLLSVLRRSPLHASYGDTLDNVTVSGPADTSFDLLLPLHGGPGGHLQGQVALQGAKLADKRWDLAFDQVQGTAQYSSGGFAAEGLSVRHHGNAGTLDLRAGAPVKDPAQAFEASYTSLLEAKDLFDRAPQMAWLQPYVHGASNWRVGVSLPRAQPGKAEPASHLRLDSDLVGTTLDLPAPLDKPADRPLPTRVDVALPLGSGEVDVAFGHLVALKAVTQKDRTGVRVVMGSDTVADAPPEHGLVVTGHTASLDAMDWISLARGGDSDEGDSLPLQQVDVQADRLLLIGGAFAQTRLRLKPQRDEIAVQLDGPSLQGTLQVPNADGAVVRGDLQRVYWQSAAAPAAPPADEEATASGALAQSVPEPQRRAVDEIDPAKLPPLALDVADLQLGKLKLGKTVLRTRRLTDGLQLDQLQLHSADQDIALTGAWRGKGEAATTRLSARLDSRNLGDLVRDLGFGGQLRAGEGELQLDAGWPGSPTGFKLAALEGNLKVAARNGQLLEVEPGAGRVLGLLSVAQLPRRLMLDFRDFFSKGFAFNRIDGEVRFGDGLAQTSQVRIEGPAADIDIRGAADLRQQQFDQTIDVHPKSGNLLTVVGAVAGGPVGAAVGAAANAVLSKPLGELGARTYRVTGPWKDPKVEVVGREEHDAADATPAAGKKADPKD
ncbi:YhdP family protein [Stenotrophomonas sp. HITSZ_GD]|uniref:YhdP family protein n=1 Tax=Stenotrophomonas sp. HITSZ_GD TaxID=3037248 RepID=UPI00240D4ECE|nr:YhdP family protein [Stenotrophomonas sp. HITSZ_GD]MDG2524464.1 YhdP family protein [Stenotrophomonas sp. HITSZ_GD]